MVPRSIAATQPSLMLGRRVAIHAVRGELVEPFPVFQEWPCPLTGSE